MKRTKYLGFIIEVGKNITRDPKKVEAIVNWDILKTVKKVKRFLGFIYFTPSSIKKFTASNAFNQFG